MKKSLLLTILLILILSVSVFGADRVDMIVLLDNSVSVLPYYDDIQGSLLSRIISEHLKPGDTFSLLTFADRPEVEIAREIKNENDIEGILAYSALLQPMGNYTDLILALRYLYKYTLDMPLSNRKKILILTDGIHDPPPGSPYFYEFEEDARKEIKKAADDIHREGWDVSIIEIRPEEVVSEETTEKENVDNSIGVIKEVSDSLGSKPNVFDKEEDDMAGVVLGIPLVSIPEHLGNTTGDLEVPLSIKNRSNEALLFSLTAVVSEGIDLLKEKKSIKLEAGENGILEIAIELPEGLDIGEQTTEIVFKLVGGLETEPKSFILRYNFQLKGGIAKGLEVILDWRIIAIIIGIIAAVIIIILLKRTHTSEKDDITPLDKKIDDEKEEIGISQHEPDAVFINGGRDFKENTDLYEKNRPVQMHVFGQNTKLGISNVHWLGLNNKRSIGSAPSSVFKIFFVKVPTLLAQIECTGDDFIFYPVKKEFFPDINEAMHNCLNKRIRIVTEDEKMFYIEFQQWISELERVNRLLSMTKHPGKPDFEY